MLVFLLLIEENVKGIISLGSLVCKIFLLDYYTTTRHRQYISLVIYFLRILMRTFCTSIYKSNITGALRSIECFGYIPGYSGKYVFSCKFLEKSLKRKKINR